MLFLAVPAVLYAKLCHEAIKAGKDVYVAKPSVLTEEEGLQIRNTLKTSSQILLARHLLQYNPAVVKAKSGTLGNLRYIRSHLFNIGKIRHEENALWSFAPHDFPVVHSIVNSPIKSIGQYLFKDGVADRVDVAMEFESGVHAEVYVSLVHPFKEQSSLSEIPRARLFLTTLYLWNKNQSFIGTIILVTARTLLQKKQNLK